MYLLLTLTPSSQEKRGGAKHGARPHEAGSVPLAHVPDEETVALRAQAPQPALTGCGSHQATQPLSAPRCLRGMVPPSPLGEVSQWPTFLGRKHG